MIAIRTITQSKQVSPSFAIGQGIYPLKLSVVLIAFRVTLSLLYLMSTKYVYHFIGFAFF